MTDRPKDSANAVELRAITLRYGRITALRDVTLDLPVGAVTGLVGRNASGKTSLLRVIAGYEPWRGDGVRVADAAILTSDRWTASADQSVSSLIGHLRRAWPRFDPERAQELLGRFGVPSRWSLRQLSRGQSSAAQVSLALASRAPITLLDEPHLGLDAPSRDLFTRLVVEELAECPRTLVISTHLIDETAALFERLIVLDAGRLVAHDTVDALLTRFVRVQGSTAQLARLAEHLVRTESLGGRLTGIVERSVLDAVAPLGVHTTPLSVQELAGVLPGALADALAKELT